MRKVLLFLVVSFIIMGTLGAHAIIPDSATVEVPTPESGYIQDTDVQSEDFAEAEPIVMEPAVVEVAEQVSDEMSVVDSEALKETVAESINVAEAESEISAEADPVIMEPVVVEVTEQVSDEMSVVDSETYEEMVAEPFNVVDVETETVIMETAVDEDSEQVTDELPVVDSEQVEKTAVVEPEVSAEPEQVVVEPVMDEITELSADEVSVVDSEASEEMVAESFNDVEVDPDPIVVEPIVDEDPEQAADEVLAIDSETTDETVAESINIVEVEPEVSADPEPVVMEPAVVEVAEQVSDEMSAVSSATSEETAVVETFNDVDVELESSVEPESPAESEPVVVEPLVDEVAEQPADELSAADPEQAESLLVETEDVAEDEESEQTPYAEEMEDMEESDAETEVPEPVAADSEPIVDDIEDVQTVMDIVPDEAGDNDMKSVDVQAEEDEPLVESDESDKKSGINGKVLLSMEATHFAWNFSSNGGGYGLALPCSGVSAEWLFSNRFACGFDVRVSTESNGTSYLTNLGILNRFGMLSSVKNFLNESNIVFFKGDVLLGLTIKDAVGGIATLPTIGLGGSVHFGRDFLTMAFGVDGTVMFPLSGADRAPVCSIRPNMSLTWIL